MDHSALRESHRKKGGAVTRLACLPLDDRPVNYDYPHYLADIVGLEIDLPPREALGNPWRSSRHADLESWLENAAREADALLVAVDTLGYGGLIPSRTSNESAERVLERLSLLKRLKTAQPSLIILAYSVILRISRADSAEEEKDYWATYGSRMFRLSYLEHKSNLSETNTEENAEREALRAQIPDPVYEDYLQGRRRNYTVNRAMLEWLEQGIFDYLILPQDDTADYGWNIAEARSLQAAIRSHGLTDRAITYPGADETASLLLARYACMQTGFRMRLWPRYSSIGSPQTVTAYEDRPIHELLKAHLAPLHGLLAESPQQADAWLFINAPAGTQGAADLQGLVARELADPSFQPPLQKDEIYRATFREMTTPRRNVDEFVRAALAAVEAGSHVALADVAFVNGADLYLGQSLIQAGLATRLSAYAGWNTAGNTLGTVLAHLALRLLALRGRPTPDQQAAHLAFLFRRILDDYYYQAVDRTRLIYEDLPALGLAPTMERLPADRLPEVEEKLRRRFEASARDLHQQFVQAGLVRVIGISRVHLPWQRLFEISFNVKVELP
jgi:hypothetical protein